MDTTKMVYKVKELDDQTALLDIDTGSHLQMAKAFFLKGVCSVVDNGMLVEVLSRINLDVYVLYACINFDRSTLENMRQAGKKYAEHMKLIL